MRNPIPTTGEPKNSATMAPISASVDEILSPLKTKGMAAGRRSFQKPGQYPAAHVFIWSRCIWVVSFNPATMFTSIGKNTITTTTAAFECQSNPNHMTRMGAVPTIGRAATKFPTGNSPRRRKSFRSTRIAVAKAAEQPMT